MLYQLRNLNDAEKQTVKQAPIWVAILIADADGTISPQEMKRIKEVIHIKTYSEHNDVHFLYEEIDNEEKIDAVVEETLSELPESGEERKNALESKLEGLNKIFPKLEQAYARQYYNSIKDIAVAVANAGGGVLGVGKISPDEISRLKLSMIEKP